MSENVRADLALPDAEEHELKARVVTHVGELIEEQGLSRAEAAAQADLTELELANILCGHVHELTLERLLGIAGSLDADWQMKVTRRW